MDIYTEFTNDVEKYISDKFPDITVNAKLEIAAYAGLRSVVLVNDAVRDIHRRDRVASYSIRKGTDT